MFFIAYTFKGQVHVFAGRTKNVSFLSCRTSALGRITRGSHITYHTLTFFIAYTFKGQVHVFAGRVKIVSRLSCSTSALGRITRGSHITSLCSLLHTLLKDKCMCLQEE